MSNTSQTVKAVIKMPSKWGDRLLRVEAIQGKLTNNTYFPTGWTQGTLTQAQFNTDVTAFVNEAAAAEGHIAGAVGLRNGAFDTLEGDLDLVLAMVQAKANNWSAWFPLKIGSGGRNLGGGSTHSSAGTLPTA